MKALFITTLILISIESYNQTVDRSILSTAGNHSETETISVSWTLGEVAIVTLSSDGLVLSQGFQQGNLVIDVIEETHSEFLLKTYPNPVVDKLIIESSNLDQLYEIIDMNGRVIKSGLIDSNPFELDLTNLPSGSYFLRAEQIQTHKIIKK